MRSAVRRKNGRLRSCRPTMSTRRSPARAPAGIVAEIGPSWGWVAALRDVPPAYIPIARLARSRLEQPEARPLLGRQSAAFGEQRSSQEDGEVLVSGGALVEGGE